MDFFETSSLCHAKACEHHVDASATYSIAGAGKSQLWGEPRQRHLFHCWSRQEPTVGRTPATSHCHPPAISIFLV